MKQCPNGHEVGDNAVSCPACGAEVNEAEKRICPQCGYEYEEDEKFCSQCGISLDNKQSDDEFYEEDNGRSKKRIVLMSAIGLFVILLGVGAWYIFLKKDYSLEGLSSVLYNYREVQSFHDGRALVVSNDEHYGFINGKGEEVIPCKYDYHYGRIGSFLIGFSEGLAPVEIDCKYSYIDRDGETAIPGEFDEAGMFDGGYAWVKKDGNWMIIDSSGEIIEETNYSYVTLTSYSEGLIAVWQDGKYGYANQKGKLVIPCKYETEWGRIPPSCFSEGLASVYIEGKYGYLDKNGNVAIPCKYESAYDFSDSLGMVKVNGKFGYIDRTGKEVIPCQYIDATRFSEGLASVKKDDKVIVIDKTGKEAFPCEYDFVDIFSEGFARVMVYDEPGKSKDGIINKSGKEVVPFGDYDILDSFSEGLALILKDDVYGFIDKNGNSTFDYFDMEDYLSKKEEREKKKQEEEERLLQSSIKEQFYNRINEINGYKVIKSIDDIKNFTKESDKEYTAEIVVDEAYMIVTYKVHMPFDNEGKLKGFKLEEIDRDLNYDIHNALPEGTMNVDEIIRRRVHGY